MPSLMENIGTVVENDLAVGEKAISSIKGCEEIMDRNFNNNYGTLSNPIYEALDTNNFTSHSSSSFAPGSTALEQYRLQLYNYALHMERLRYIPQQHTPSQPRQQQFSGEAIPSTSTYSPVAYSSNPRLAFSMSLFPQHIFKSEDPKPQHSYIGLIAMAILGSTELKLVLSDIYQYILDNYPYFRTRGPGWRNSIRHNLSLNDCFVKSGRSANGKGHYWAIHPANMDDFRKGDFRRRKAQRKVRKHMGLSVDDTGTDSPSPPPLDLSSPPPSHSSTLVSNAHSLTVTQQIAAFNYFQQQQPITIVGPPEGNQHLSFRPLAARYYITTSPSNLSSNAQKFDPKNNSSNKLKTSSPAGVIENLYTRSRKRQFDVASLLAPDIATSSEHQAILEQTTSTTRRTMFDVGDDTTDTHRVHKIDGTSAVRTTQLQHTVITKVTMNQCNRHITVEEFSDDQNEDIDVVDDASDGDQDKHESTQYKQFHSNIESQDSQPTTISKETLQGYTNHSSCLYKEGENSCNSDSRQSSFSDIDTNVDCVTNSSKNSDSTTSLVPKSCDAQAKNKGASHFNIISFPTDDQAKLLAPTHNQQIKGEEIVCNNSMDPIILSRYYGTYMTAARRLHIGTAFNP